VKAPSLLSLLGLSGCALDRSIFAPRGAGAQAIAQLGWLMIGVCLFVTVVMLAIFFHALFRASSTPRTDGRAEVTTKRWVGAGVGATVLILTGLVAASFATDRALSVQGAQAPAVYIDVIAHQWWWEIRYKAQNDEPDFVTANELHLPVGEAVSLTLQSQDVIHSFWLPNIDRKRDIIPGHEQSISLVAKETGTWHGRCAEFCGYQHAHMELLAVVESRQTFDQWRAGQAHAALPPSSPLSERGAAVFSEGLCGTCHVVRGSPAAGFSSTAPDLTHLASRQMLAAGTLPNNPGALAAWITDPQRFKPGVKMAVNRLSEKDREALVSYLGSLE
jgi:cytochrome c oxidase subunit 2